jgi:hypothetical protein
MTPSSRPSRARRSVKYRRGHVPDKIDNGPADVRRQGFVGRQQGQEIWDDTDLARVRDSLKGRKPMVLATDTVQPRALLEQRAHEPNDLVGDGPRHASVVPRRRAVSIVAPTSGEWSVELR